MQRIVTRRALSSASQTNFLRLPQQKRCFSYNNIPNPCPPQMLEICPDIPEPCSPKMPEFSYTPPKYTGPSSDEIIEVRDKHLIAQKPYYKEPLNLVHGEMQYVFDDKGKRYLDALAGVAVVSCGHRHPCVVEAIKRQMDSIQHTTIFYLNHTLSDYLKAFAKKMPGNLSGTEANELAILMARLYTGRNDIISLRNAYHGLAPASMATNGLSTVKFDVVQTGIHHALNPDPYRGVFGSDGKKYADDVESIIKHATSGKVAGFISETIQGAGGVLELAPGYLPAVYECVKKAGGLCIADEAITGFGRTGSHYWAFESQGVIPDIVTMAKGIGNGSPISAVVTTPEIAEVLNSHSYLSTFAANEISTTAGLAVLNVIDKCKLQQNAQVVGSHLKGRLTALKDKYELIGDVRGRGLMLGVDIVSDRKLKTPAPAFTDQIFERMKDLGVLVGKAGLYRNVLRIMPPLCITKKDADFIADVLDCAIWSITK